MFVSRQTLSALITLLVAHVLLVGPAMAASATASVTVPGMAVHEKGNGEIGLGDMASLDDDQLSDVTGQSLLFSGYRTGDGTLANGAAGYDFYQLGADVQMSLNTNVKSLKLGCGGINGAGVCDIDIDNLSLSGVPGSANCFGGSGSRPNCDMVMTRPFIEFAIKNPGSLANRTVAGVRLGAQQATGLLTAGSNTALPNGINRLSGYMSIQSTTGTANTQPGVFGRGDSGGNETLTGKANINIIGCTSGCGNGKNYNTVPASSAGINIPTLAVPFTIPAFTVNGSRLQSTTVNASANIPQISVTYTDGDLAVHLQQQVCVIFLICLQDTKLRAQMQISGIIADIAFSENLGFIHNIPVNNPFSLSLQKEAIKWPGNTDTAQRGWWMAFQDPIDLGVLSPSNQVDIKSVYPQLATLLSAWLAANPTSITTGAGLQALVSGYMDQNIGPVNLGGAHVAMNLNDLQLSTQNVTSNCWGTLTFC